MKLTDKQLARLKLAQKLAVERVIKEQGIPIEPSGWSVDTTYESITFRYAFRFKTLNEESSDGP